MIQTGSSLRVLVAVEPVDFRKGIDTLAAVCRQRLQQDPMNGWAFVFRNRTATALKILLYDGQGFWLCQKRLSQGRFRWWPSDAATGRFPPGPRVAGAAVGRQPRSGGHRADVASRDAERIKIREIALAFSFRSRYG